MERNLTLSDVVCDPALQVREELDRTWIDELADLYRDNHKIDAVTVVLDGERHLLVDGWHRIEAQRIAWGSDAVIAAEVIDASGTDDPMAVAKTRAAMANRDGGLRRTDGDKRRAVLLLRSTAAGRKMTHDEIGKRIGVSRSRVTQILSAERPDVSTNVGDNLDDIKTRPTVLALRAQVDAALRADPGKPDSQHAEEIGCGRDIVRRRRAELGLPKSDSKRWREDSPRAAIAAALQEDPTQPNRVLASRLGAAPETVSKVREEMGLGPSTARGNKYKNASVAPPPSAPVNPKRTDDPREQGQEILASRPVRPPPASPRDFVTSVLQMFERADRLDRQAAIAAVYKRWPELLVNAIDEAREQDSAVLN